MKTLLTWSWCHIALTVVSSTFSPVVTYVSFTTPTYRSSTVDSNNSTVLNYVSGADDTPIEAVILPQVIPYYGQYFDRIYVAPNGYVQISPIPSCGAHYCPTCPTDFLPYEEGIIAAFLSDFNPSSNIEATVSYKYYTDEVVFIYNDISLYGSTDTFKWRFRIAIATSGAVRISYDNVPQVISNVSELTCWITGLLAPMETGVIPLTAMITSRQLTIGTEVWKSNISGIFPSNSSVVKSGVDFHGCPVSTTWCGLPSQLNTSAGDAAPLIFNISTLSASCRADFKAEVFLEYAVYLSVHSNLTVRGSQPVVVSETDDYIATCSEYADNHSTPVGPVKFACDITHFKSRFTFPSGYMYISWRVQYATSKSSRAFTLLEEVPPIPVTAGGNGTQCSLNQPAGTCAACDVCSGQNLVECMDLECTADEAEVSSAAPYPTDIMEPLDALYTVLSCNTSCRHVFDYTSDLYGACCNLDDLDCLGVCNGSSVAAISKDTGTFVCCEPNTHIDCGGVCGGSMVFDTCNICGGNDTGVKCATNVSIDLDSTDPHAFYTFYHGGDDVALSRVTVSNNGNTSIRVRFTMSDTTQKKDPRVWVPVGEYDILPDISVVYNITSSLSRLYDVNGNVSSWDVKTVKLEYKRPGTFDDYISYDFDILPAATDCTFLTRATCKNLPGCIHCLDFKDSLRVLSSVQDGEEVSDNADWELAFSKLTGSDYTAMMQAYESRRDGSGNAAGNRRLYASILPDRASVPEGKATGKCQVGWEPIQCDTWVHDAATSLRLDTRNMLSFILTLVVVFFVYILN